MSSVDRFVEKPFLRSYSKSQYLPVKARLLLKSQKKSFLIQKKKLAAAKKTRIINALFSDATSFFFVASFRDSIYSFISIGIITQVYSLLSNGIIVTGLSLSFIFITTSSPPMALILSIRYPALNPSLIFSPS